jgi:hypothetical protein
VATERPAAGAAGELGDPTCPLGPGGSSLPERPPASAGASCGAHVPQQPLGQLRWPTGAAGLGARLGVGAATATGSAAIIHFIRFTSLHLIHFIRHGQRRDHSRPACFGEAARAA